MLAAIPGQSLTTTPRNASYENPPEIVEPDKALTFYMDKLSDHRTMDSLMQLLQNDVPLQTLVEGLLRGGVAGGKHSIDVSLIIAPVLHEYIKGTADAIGIEYDEGEDFQEDDDDEVQKESGKAMAASTFKYEEPMDEPVAEEVPMPEAPVEEAPKRGLMSRMEGI